MYSRATGRKHETNKEEAEGEGGGLVAEKLEKTVLSTKKKMERPE